MAPCTGAMPVLATPVSVSPETLMVKLDPGSLVPLSLTTRTVCTADGLGGVGIIGIAMGRKTSPQLTQISNADSTAARRSAGWAVLGIRKGKAIMIGRVFLGESLILNAGVYAAPPRARVKSSAGVPPAP